MAHEIWDTDRFITVRKPAWHGLGQVLDEYPTRAEAQQLVHPWEPITESVYLSEPEMRWDAQVGEWFPEARYDEAPGFKAVRRSDNGHLLGIVGEGYEPVTNNEMWDIAEALQGGASNDVKFETAGSLQGGAKVWLLITLNEPITLAGDPHGATLPYYSLQNAHNGSGAFRGQATMTRIVCANTAHIADLDARARGTEFTFKHTKNVGERIEEARQALQGWRESLTIWKQLSEHMLNLSVEQDDVLEFVDRWIPMPPENLATERVIRNVEAARADWWGAYQSQTCEGIQGTAHGLLQASTEYAEHFRRAQSAESRFRRSFLDRSEVVQSAQKLILSIAR